jgi:hypothetical protein
MNRDLIRKSGWFAAVLCCFGFADAKAADVDLARGSVAHFASIDEGREILGNRDEFVQRLSPFDRAARLKTDRPVSEDDFLKFVKSSVLEWTDTERKKIEDAIGRIRPGVQNLSLTLPQKIQFVKTTGAEEGKAFYTRDSAIVLPASEIENASPELLEKTIAHELFHIFSRQNPALREKLYQIIGFTKCDEVQFPADLRDRKITNPDAPRNDHFIKLKLDGRDIAAVPILFSKVANYDVSHGGEFFSYLQLKLLILPANGNTAGDAELAAPEQISGFIEQVGQNTSYLIHPEEILADNFALLVLGMDDVPSPKILERMRAVLGQRP